MGYQGLPNFHPIGPKPWLITSVLGLTMVLLAAYIYIYIYIYIFDYLDILDPHDIWFTSLFFLPL